MQELRSSSISHIVHHALECDLGAALRTYPVLPGLHALLVSKFGSVNDRRAVLAQTLTPDGLRNLGPSVERMAAIEGLDAHKRAVSLRLAALCR